MADGKLSVSDVFARGFAAVHSNPLVFFGVPLLFSGIPGLIGLFIDAQITAGGPPTLFAHPVIGLVGIVIFLISLIGSGALIQTTLAYGQQRQASFGEALAAGLRYYVPLLAASLISGIAIMIGFFLLLVPGLILLTMWAVVGAAIVGEDSGVLGAFTRSRELTRGSRWRIFGLGVLLFVILALFGAAFAAVSFVANLGIFGMSSGFSIGGGLLNMVRTTVTASYSVAILTALYLELRALRGSAEPDQLAEVFA